MALLGEYIEEYSVRNKQDKPLNVYSITNSKGFCKDYFGKDVSSANKKTYKVVPRGYFAYNPSRINVGSIDWQNKEDEVIVSPLYNIFKCKEGLEQDYLKIFLKSHYGKHLIDNNTTGSVRANLKLSVLSSFELNIPSVEEQKNFVRIINYLFDAIQNEENQLVLLDELVKARFVEMFGDLKFNDKNFPIKKLNEISQFWNGLTYKPSDVVDDPEKGTLVLRSSNIQNGSLSFDDNVYVSCLIKDKQYVKENDILMCSRNGSARLVGKTALINGLNKPTSFGAFMMIIRSDYYPYLKTYFEMDAFKSQISTGTSTINQITGNMLKQVAVPVPDMDLINEFDMFVKQVDKSKLICQQKIKLYQELLDKKMDEYFNPKEVENA